MNIPLTKPYFSEAEPQAATEVIKSGWLVQGHKVEKFERMVAEYVGAKYAVATSSCTAALHLALLLSGVGPGDEVICPSYTFVATANAIIYCGAKPVFVEIDPKTYNIDPSRIEEAVTYKTRAILPVHQFGLPADMKPIIFSGQQYDLAIVEDAAHALGSMWHGERIGNMSPVSCFSFHPRKIITTGEGGMITTDDNEIAQEAKMMRSHGAAINPTHNAEDAIHESFDMLGYNYRMTDIQAAIGIEQMRKLDYICRRRTVLAERYNILLADMEELYPPYVPLYAGYNYSCYTIRITEKCQVKRNDIILAMAAKGISCRQGIPPIHQQPCYKAMYGEVSLPITEHISQTSFLLPLYPDMTDDVPGIVVDALKDVLANG